MQETWVRALGWEDPRRKEMLPTPVFWPGEVHGLYGPWCPKESDTTERLSLSRAPGWSLETYFFTINLFGYAGSRLQHARPLLRPSSSLVAGC